MVISFITLYGFMRKLLCLGLHDKCYVFMGFLIVLMMRYVGLIHGKIVLFYVRCFIRINITSHEMWWMFLVILHNWRYIY